MRSGLTAYLALNALPPVVRRCEDLVHLHGMSPEVVARRLTLSLQTVAQHLLAARAARQAYAATLGHRQPDDAPAPVASPSQPSAVMRAAEDRKLARELAGDNKLVPVPKITVCKPEKRLFTVAQDEMIALALAGMRPVDIALRVGRDVINVSAALTKARKNGIAVPRFSKWIKMPPGSPACEQVFTPTPLQSEIIALACAGLRPTDIAPRVGRSTAHVSATLCKARKNNISIPSFKVTRVAAPEPIREPKPRSASQEMVALAQQGVRVAEITSHLGKPRSAVHQILSVARRRGEVIPYDVWIPKQIREPRFVGTPQDVVALATDGVENSEVRHVSLTQFYAAMKQPALLVQLPPAPKLETPPRMRIARRQGNRLGRPPEFVLPPHTADNAPKDSESPTMAAWISRNAA